LIIRSKMAARLSMVVASPSYFIGKLRLKLFVRAQTPMLDALGQYVEEGLAERLGLLR
jgi:hypothetical protein